MEEKPGQSISLRACHVLDAGHASLHPTTEMLSVSGSDALPLVLILLDTANRSKHLHFLL